MPRYEPVILKLEGESLFAAYALRYAFLQAAQGNQPGENARGHLRQYIQTLQLDNEIETAQYAHGGYARLYKDSPTLLVSKTGLGAWLSCPRDVAQGRTINPPGSRIIAPGEDLYHDFQRHMNGNAIQTLFGGHREGLEVLESFNPDYNYYEQGPESWSDSHVFFRLEGRSLEDVNFFLRRRRRGSDNAVDDVREAINLIADSINDQVDAWRKAGTEGQSPAYPHHVFFATGILMKTRDIMIAPYAADTQEPIVLKDTAYFRVKREHRVYDAGSYFAIEPIAGTPQGDYLIERYNEMQRVFTVEKSFPDLMPPGAPRPVIEDFTEGLYLSYQVETPEQAAALANFLPLGAHRAQKSEMLFVLANQRDRERQVITPVPPRDLRHLEHAKPREKLLSVNFV